MRLISFQSMEAVKQLFINGYLEADEQYINIEKMNDYVLNEYKVKFPLWCWVKFKKGICPPKHKGSPVKGFDVKITFEKPRKDVFVTDYRKYSFLLNNVYIPDNKQEKEQFEKELKEYDITAEELKAVVRKDKYSIQRTDKEFMDICHKIQKSFNKCIDDQSDVLQGCVWRINLDEVLKIEMLHDSNYSYGSFNYLRKNGKRFNWIKDFYDKLM